MWTILSIYHTTLTSFSFYCSGSLPREPIPLSVTGRLPASADLEAYALDQWEVRMTKLNSECFYHASFPPFFYIVISLPLSKPILRVTLRRLPVFISLIEGLYIYFLFSLVIVLLVAIDQFISSWKRDEFQLLHDEDISAWPSEFKVPSGHLVLTVRLISSKLATVKCVFLWISDWQIVVTLYFF